MKEANRGEGGRVLWSYTLEPENTGTRLSHHMQVLLPAKGAGQLKAMYAVFGCPRSSGREPGRRWRTSRRQPRLRRPDQLSTDACT